MFGRRKRDEDPFAALRDGATYQSAPGAVPEVGLESHTVSVGGLGSVGGLESAGRVVPAGGLESEPRATPTVRAQPAGAGIPASRGLGQPPRSTLSSRRRSGGIGVPVAARLVAVAVVIAAVAIPLATSVNKAVHSIHVPLPTFSTGSASVPAPAALRPISYLRPAGVRAGLAHVEKVAPGARLSLLRIDSKSLSVTAVFPNGQVKQVHFGPTVTSVTPGASTGQRALPVSAIHPAAVARIVTAMGRLFHVPPRHIDYMVISSPPGLPPRWILFTTAPSHPGFAASLSGTGLTKLG